MDNKTRATMDLDLTEYDQMDEFRQLMMDNQIYCDNSKLLVTLSSSSDQTPDEGNCENDFVFLPSPLNQQQQPPPPSPPQPQLSLIGTRPKTLPAEVSKLSQQPACSLERAAVSNDENLSIKGVLQQPSPLLSLNSNSKNPFGKYHLQQAREVTPESDPFQSRQQVIRREVMENCWNKPYGLIETCSSAGNNANKLADLMQQIVTRSDLIHIAIPCACCHEPVACPPSDISSWVNHMNKQHNCKLCPVCNRMVGLGPERDINVIRKHVLEHLDEAWLERKANRISFSYGLQQQWFSGNRCVVRDLNYR